MRETIKNKVTRLVKGVSSFYLFTLLPLLFGCTDYLDIKPYGRTIPQSAEEFSALVHSMCYDIDYGNVPLSYVFGSYGQISSMEPLTDNMATNLTAGTNTDHLSYFLGQALSGKQSEYTGIYEVIRNCNIILGEFLEGRDTREGRDIVGTCYAIRGVCYYQLLRCFCAPPLAEDAKLGVPIVTEFDMDARPLRSTIDETIAQAESDLKTAISYDIQDEMYRFNNDVLHGCLARLYHWCGRWQEARREAQLVVSRHPLLGADEYATMMSTQYGLCGNKLFMADRLSTSQLGISGAMTNMEGRPLSASYCTLYAEGTNDVRRRGNLFFNRKRTNRKLFFTGMRSAEMALIAMECAYHLNKPDSALLELNQLRRLRITGMFAYNNATLPPVDSTGLIRQDATGRPLTPLIQAILNERRKELYLENCDRFYELKRHGRPEFWVGVRGQKYWTRRYMYTFPIALNDIQLQPGLIQNPGYDKTY